MGLLPKHGDTSVRFQSLQEQEAWIITADMETSEFKFSSSARRFLSDQRVVRVLMRIPGNRDSSPWKDPAELLKWFDSQGFTLGPATSAETTSRYNEGMLKDVNYKFLFKKS
jgi:hypothetical protein